MSEIVSLLRRLGFAEYEAKAYVALLQRSPLNGYELAKASGVPRADIYSVLQRLEERGAAVRLDTETGTRYAPIPPEEIIQRLQTNFQETLDATERSLKEIATPIEHEYIWNARGYPVLLEHAKGMIDGSQKQLTIAISPPEAGALAENLSQAEARGVEITTLCTEACPHECGACRGHIHRYHVAQENGNRWLVIVADQTEVLAGEIDQDDALAIRTRQRLLIDLITWYIRHSIALATVINDLGNQFDQLLQPDTKAVLASIGPGGQEGGWLEHMRKVLRQQKRTDDSSERR